MVPSRTSCPCRSTQTRASSLMEIAGLPLISAAHPGHARLCAGSFITLTTWASPRSRRKISLASRRILFSLIISLRPIFTFSRGTLAVAWRRPSHLRITYWSPTLIGLEISPLLMVKATSSISFCPWKRWIGGITPIEAALATSLEYLLASSPKEAGAAAAIACTCSAERASLQTIKRAFTASPYCES